MGWKDLSSIKKGMLIGLIAGIVMGIFGMPIVFFVFTIISLSLGQASVGESFIGKILVYPYALPCKIINAGEDSFGCFLTIGLVTSIIWYALLGVIIGLIIGWIVGKIREGRKKEDKWV